VLTRSCAAPQKPQSGPASSASVIPQGCQIRCGNNRQIETRSQVVGDAVVAIDPSCTHWEWRCLFFAEHELIKYERSVRAGKKLAESYGPDGLVSSIKVRW